MKSLLLICAPDEMLYAAHLKPILAKFSQLRIQVSSAPVTTLTQVTHLCRTKKYDGVLTTSLDLLKKLVGVKISEAEASLDNYAGSFFKYAGVEFVILNPLKQLITVPYGKFLAERFISKLATPERWIRPPRFDWKLATPQNIEQLYKDFAKADLIAIDIETKKEPFIHITEVGYTAVWYDGKAKCESLSIVLPINDMWAVAWMRKFNLLTPPKVFQNGKYDNNYLMAYNAPVYNWLFDTANLFHSWYSELPKNLGFLQAFFIREGAYWKDLARSSDRQDQYKYNAMDTWATACAAMAAINEIPTWAIHNYLNEFPLNFPCVLSELTGLLRDTDALSAAATIQNDIIINKSASMDRMLNTKGFNSGSPKQKRALLTILGCKDIAAVSTDEKSLKKAAYRHPLNARILNQITEIQKAKKLHSTYLNPGKEHNGVILYALNPHGTDTSRLASKEHHFWCGLQIQNIPRGKIVKQTLRAYEGFRFAECDLEQAESRDTAYAAGEERLIAAVSGDKDFHSLNAASFFGVSYGDIYDEVARAVRDKERRELGKKVNHGANYLMGAGVLVETMGEENVYKAAKLLRLPKSWTAYKIAEYLLEQFHATYPGLSQVYYPAIVSEVSKTKMLSSRAEHKVARAFECTDWNLTVQEYIQGLTRYCFSNPLTDKRAKNGYVAHVSQSLNAMTLNKAYMLVFYNIAINEKYSKHFKLCAQIHDSILFQFREGHEYLCAMVKDLMEIPVTIKGYDGKERTFTVPAAIKAGKDSKGALTWADI